MTALAEFLVLLTLVVLAAANCLLLSWVELGVIWLLVLGESSILGAMLFLLERQGIPAKLGVNELTTTRSALAVLVGCLAPVLLGTWILLAPPAPLETWNLRLGVLFAVAIMLLRFWMENASAPREVALLIDLRQGLAFDRVSTPVAMELGSVIHYGLELGNLVASHLRTYLYWMNEEARLSREFREFIEWLSSLPPGPPPDGPSDADKERVVAAQRTNNLLERASVLRFQAEQQFADRLHRIQRFYPEAQPDQRILEPLNRAKAELEREQKELNDTFEAATRKAVKTGVISEEDAARLTQGDAPTPPATPRS